MAERTARILLVDDEQSIQTLLSYPLRRDGYEVVQATDGRQALDRFDEQTFDLVVLDLMLPRGDGLEVCRQIRSRSAVPIIMLTAKSEEIDKVVGLELGADDYITKPFSMREFSSRIKAALRRAEMSRPAETAPDEAPLVVREIFGIVRTLNEKEGLTVLVVEQNANIALDNSEHAYVLEAGRVALHGSSTDLRKDESVRRSYLGY